MFLLSLSLSIYIYICSKERDPNPKDNSLMGEETSTFIQGISFRVCSIYFPIRELLLGLGALSLLLRRSLPPRGADFLAPGPSGPGEKCLESTCREMGVAQREPHPQKSDFTDLVNANCCEYYSNVFDMIPGGGV